MNTVPDSEPTRDGLAIDLQCDGSNTIALQFNMIAAGNLPKAKRNAFVGLS